MTIPLNQDQTEELKKFFDQIDQDHNGKIDKEELKQLLETIWGNNTDFDINEAVASIFKKCDLNEDGFISFDELASLAK
ncbi:MAG: EF-hand domain-containing protein [Crocosphaera sp.]